MKIQNKIDQHSHSKFSPDSDAELSALCNQAIALGYKAYAITDHCECDLYEVDGYHKRLAQAFDAIQSIKADFPTLNLLNGLELGQPLQNIEVANEIVTRPYDVILGSLHRIAGMVDFYFLDYNAYSQAELDNLLEKYYTELYQSIQWGKFDVVTHLTYPLRYIVGDAKRTVDLTRYNDHFAAIFRLMAQQGKALEINTSGLKKSLGACMPDFSLIKQFYDYGGELISIGSDAHQVDALGAGLEHGIELAYQAGFRQHCYFKQRTPHTLSIE